jgi:hypothetical protein
MNTCLASAVDVVLPLASICDGADMSHYNVADMGATLRQRIQAVSLTHVIHPKKSLKPLSFKQMRQYSSCQLPVSQPAIACGMHLALPIWRHLFIPGAWFSYHAR